MNQITKELKQKIQHFSKFPQTGVSLRQMVKFGQDPSIGTLLKSSQFVSEELPIRLAHRTVELDNLPYDLNEMPSIIKVKNWYAESFQDLINFNMELPTNIKALFKVPNKEVMEFPIAMPNFNYPNNAASSGIPLSHRFYVKVDENEISNEVVKQNEEFVKVIEAIKRRHDAVVTTMAQGIKEFKYAKKGNYIDNKIQNFLDRFYLSRIGIRMLLGQHIALHRGPKKPNYVGIICTKTNLSEIAMEAIENAKFICEDYYGLFKGPEVILVCPNKLEFLYVSSHLHHILFELLKNSLRAVVERYGEDWDHYPPIKIIVSEGKEDIAIKITDEGGGIPRSGINNVWTYMYTTAETPLLDPNFNQTDFKAPLAGFGYGLPLSRLYARYFGGDLRIISMEGYGTDAYIHLNRLSDSEEPLP